MGNSDVNSEFGSRSQQNMSSQSFFKKEEERMHAGKTNWLLEPI